MALTKVAPSIISVANNVVSTTVGNTTSIPSITFDGSGVIISVSNNAIAVTPPSYVANSAASYANSAFTKANNALTASSNTTTNVQFGSFGVGTAASGTTGEIRATNNITAYYSSDKRYKKNVINIQSPLEKLQQINGVEFDWTEEYMSQHGGEDGYFIREHDIGVIAQEIEAILPEIVATREDGYKAVKYDRIVALLIEAIKELKCQVDELKNNK